MEHRMPKGLLVALGGLRAAASPSLALSTPGRMATGQVRTGMQPLIYKQVGIKGEARRETGLDFCSRTSQEVEVP